MDTRHLASHGICSQGCIVGGKIRVLHRPLPFSLSPLPFSSLLFPFSLSPLPFSSLLFPFSLSFWLPVFLSSLSHFFTLSILLFFISESFLLWRWNSFSQRRHSPSDNDLKKTRSQSHSVISLFIVAPRIKVCLEIDREGFRFLRV